jgi:uncharacterized protein (TIGR03000 family)
MYSVVLLMAISGGADVPACHASHGCHGGYASCHGGAGCHGGRASCHGGEGCHGGYASCHGGGGCHGGRHHAFGGRRHSCHGGGGCYGSSYGCCGGGAPVGGEKPKDMPKPGDKPKDKEDEVSTSAPATIIVSLPAEAKLSIDDAATSATGAVRTFVSPNLNNGREYHYDLKAEVGGKTIAKRITVRAGEETRVQIDMDSIAAK